MNFPPPTEKQAQILWFSSVMLAVAVALGLIGAAGWALGALINKLASVLLPLAVAGILACLLDPVVDFFQQKARLPRVRAILIVFFLGVSVILLLLATVVPRLVVEANELINNLPQFSEKFRTNLSEWLAGSVLGQRAKEAWDQQVGANVQSFLADLVPTVSLWLWEHVGALGSWLAYAVGAALVPVYLFYLLLEKSGIQRNWTDYLPVRKSQVKEELVFILSSINDCTVVFFRGQILVSLCSGTLLGIGLTIAGLKYSLLIGALAAMIGVLPYIGAMISFVVAMVLAGVQYGDGAHFLGVVVVFAVVQAAEGLFYSPKILGGRVGLHPLTIIVAVMFGTKLLGGILGGLLAIPLTAALRTLMFRYVWGKPAGTPALPGPAPAATG